MIEEVFPSVMMFARISLDWIGLDWTDVSGLEPRCILAGTDWIRFCNSGVVECLHLFSERFLWPGRSGGICDRHLVFEQSGRSTPLPIDGVENGLVTNTGWCDSVESFCCVVESKTC